MIIDSASAHMHIQCFCTSSACHRSFTAKKTSLSNTPPLSMAFVCNPVRYLVSHKRFSNGPDCSIAWPCITPGFLGFPQSLQLRRSYNWFDGGQMTDIRISLGVAGEEDFWPSPALAVHRRKASGRDRDRPQTPVSGHMPVVNIEA